MDPLTLQGVTSNLLTFQSQAAEYDAAAQGSLLNAEGADVEAAAYETAAGISDESQRVEAVAESVREIQQQRAIDQTVGGISASVAANGFQQSGSALDIMRSSMQQGYLAQQISSLQSQQTQRGFMEQAAAARGEMSAAKVRADAARLLAQAQMNAGNSARANQAALTDALTQLLKGDPNAQKLVDDLLAGDIAGVQGDALLYDPSNPSSPTNTATGTGSVFGISPWNAAVMSTGQAPGSYVEPFSAGTGNSGTLATTSEGSSVKFVPFSG